MRGSQPTVRDDIGTFTVDIALDIGLDITVEVMPSSSVEFSTRLPEVRARLVRVAIDLRISAMLAAVQPADSATFAGLEQWLAITQELGMDVRPVLIDPPYAGDPPRSLHRSPEGVRRRLHRCGVPLAATIDARLPPETHRMLIHQLLAGLPAHSSLEGRRTTKPKRTSRRSWAMGPENLCWRRTFPLYHRLQGQHPRL
jgi:hypothetical protein